MGQILSKKDIARRLAQQTGHSVAGSSYFIDRFLLEVTDALKRGDRITLPGFGTFDTRDRAPRVGRNPRTGETVPIAATRGVGFKAGRALRSAVKEAEA